MSCRKEGAPALLVPGVHLKGLIHQRGKGRGDSPRHPSLWNGVGGGGVKASRGGRVFEISSAMW